MNCSGIKSFYIVLVLVGFMTPVQAFNVSAWFSSLSSRSKGTVCVAVATALAGVGFFAYKIWSKSKNQERRSQAALPIIPAVQPVIPIQPVGQPAIQPFVALAQSASQPAVKPLFPASMSEQLDAEEKQKKENEEIINSGDWVSKKFNVPEDPTCVAVGKSLKGNTIILVGGIGCIYHIDTTTEIIKKFPFPGLQVQANNKEKIRSIKILPNNLFIAQSTTHVCLCSFEGIIREELTDDSCCRYGAAGPWFNSVDVGTDKQGKSLVCITKDGLGPVMLEDLTMKRKPFGEVDIADFSDENHVARCIVERDEEGNLKVFRVKKRRIHDTYSYTDTWDVRTCTQVSTDVNFDGGMILSDGDGNRVRIGYRTIWFFPNRMATLDSIDTGGVIEHADLGKCGRCVISDDSGRFQIWDIKQRMKQEIQMHPASSCYIALDRRSLGNAYFVSAAKNGAIRLWTNEKEKKQADDDADKAAKMYGDFKNDNGDSASAIIREYVGSDAEQALAEIYQDKDADKAAGFLEYLNGSQPDVQNIMRGYIEPDADQALVEIHAQKQIEQKHKEDADKAWAELQQ